MVPCNAGRRLITADVPLRKIEAGFFICGPWDNRCAEGALAAMAIAKASKFFRSLYFESNRTTKAVTAYCIQLLALEELDVAGLDGVLGAYDLQATFVDQLFKD